MKKIAFLLTLLLCCYSITYAQNRASASKQQKIYINLANGDQIVKNVWEVESITFTQDDNTLSCIAPQERTDLGLSVLWAPFNLGATTPKSAGYLVGWGDPTGQNYSTNNKYFPSAKPTGNITSTTNDLAKQMWEGEWRMPTSKEMQELIDECNWTWVEQEDSVGFIVSSKTNDGEIFLPVTGIRKGTLDAEKMKEGFYWTGNLASDDQEATFLGFNNETVSLADTLRYLGMAIRPVYGKLRLGITLTANIIGKPAQTTANIAVNMKGDIDEINEYGIIYGTSPKELNRKATIGTSVPTKEDYQATLENLSLNTTYYYAAYSLQNKNYSYSDTLSFTTQPKYTKPTEAIDLGLSVKWSPWNMGAGDENDEGLYLAWGDPTGETPNYSQGNKLNNIAGTSLDIAHAVWGGKWRMPTASEMAELANLEWQFEKRYGVSGWVIKGKNGNSIWMPMHGYKRDNSISNSTQGFYWTAETDNSLHPCVAEFLAENYMENQNVSDKTWGLFIRPVYDDSGITPEQPGENDPYASHAVDLGLSSYWSDCNLGGNTPTDIGDYYAWGETESKSEFSKSNYTLLDSNDESGYKVIGENGKTISGTEYDAAKVKLGGKWQMPTTYDIQELLDLCSWEETTINGVSGYKVTGTNGNSIFLPYSGYKTDNVYGNSNSGYYWSGTIYEHGYTNEWGGTIAISESGGFWANGKYRYQGCVIRPVKIKK